MSLPDGCVELCPGCRYRELSAPESDRRKQEWASAQLAPWAHTIAPLRAPTQRWGYRRKALLHARPAAGGWEFGLLRRAGPRDFELVPIPRCPVHEPALNEALKVLRTLIPPRAPLAFVLASGGLFTLVFKCAPAPTLRAWAREQEPRLRAAGVLGLQLNWNPAAGQRAVSSRHQERVFGPALVEAEGEFHGALSFRQQIPTLEREALSLAEAHLARANAAVAVDLYSGAGASLRRWERRGWKVVGVELGGEACEAARRTAPGAAMLRGRVEHRLPQLDEFLGGEEFVAYTNPPRDGHAETVLAWLLERAPGRIAYLSCNAKTLGRDLVRLEGSYAVDRIQTFDFFPQTDHVESLALLTRR